MDLTSIYYFAELSKDLHMTNTARRLYISQQTLSNHIARLEEELGAQLICRRPKPMLTLAGQVFLEHSRKILLENKNLLDRIADIRKEQDGLLRIGASHFRMNNSIPHILPEFHSRYPHVQLDLRETTSSQAETLVEEGALDFSIVLAGTPRPHVKAHHLLTDQVYVCVSDHLLQKHYTISEWNDLKEDMPAGLTLARLSRLPYCLFHNRIGQQIQRCFEESGFQPQVLLTSTHMEICMSACREGLAACFSTQMSLAQEQRDLPADINVFPLLCGNGIVSQQLVTLYLKDRYLPSYAQFFLQLLLQYFTSLENESLTQVAPR